MISWGFKSLYSGMEVFFKLADRMRSMRTTGASKNRDCRYTKWLAFSSWANLVRYFGTYGMYTYGMYTYGMYTYGMYTVKSRVLTRPVL